MHYAALMTSRTELLAHSIGVRVRQVRQRRQWTLDELAAQAGVSRRMVVSVEQGTVNPSVGTLLRLSEALGIGLPELVEPPSQQPAILTRDGDGARLWSGAAGGSGVLVANATAPHVVALWDWTLTPGERHDSDPHPAGTQELLQVRAGEVALEVSNQRYALAQGDAISFSGDEVHAYANSSSVIARFTLVVFEPGVTISARAATTPTRR